MRKNNEIKILKEQTIIDEKGDKIILEKGDVISISESSMSRRDLSKLEKEFDETMEKIVDYEYKLNKLNNDSYSWQYYLNFDNNLRRHGGAGSSWYSSDPEVQLYLNSPKEAKRELYDSEYYEIDFIANFNTRYPDFEF